MFAKAPEWGHTLTCSAPHHLLARDAASSSAPPIRPPECLSCGWLHESSMEISLSGARSASWTAVEVTVSAAMRVRVCCCRDASRWMQAAISGSQSRRCLLVLIYPLFERPLSIRPASLAYNEE